LTAHSIDGLKCKNNHWSRFNVWVFLKTEFFSWVKFWTLPIFTFRNFRDRWNIFDCYSARSRNNISINFDHWSILGEKSPAVYIKNYNVIRVDLISRDVNFWNSIRNEYCTRERSWLLLSWLFWYWLLFDWYHLLKFLFLFFFLRRFDSNYNLRTYLFCFFYLISSLKRRILELKYVYSVFYFSIFLIYLETCWSNYFICACVENMNYYIHISSKIIFPLHFIKAIPPAHLFHYGMKEIAGQMLWNNPKLLLLSFKLSSVFDQWFWIIFDWVEKTLLPVFIEGNFGPFVKNSLEENSVRRHVVVLHVMKN